jgi:hypothetical protein
MPSSERTAPLPSPALSSLSRGDRKLALLVLTFLVYPIALCVVFFPTPSADLREQINWGMLWPLYTWKHPPLQSWVIGAVALTGARDAWPFVLAAEILNVGLIFYLWRIAKSLLDPDNAKAAIIVLCGSIYIAGGELSWTIGSDVLLLFLWTAMIFHALRAWQADRWRDWILLGLFAGLALLTKYYSAVFLISLAAAAMVLPERRNVLFSVRAVAAILICALIFSINLIPMLQHREMLHYSGTVFDFNATIKDRFLNYGAFLLNIVAYNLSFFIAVVAATILGDQQLVLRKPSAEARPIILIALLLFIFMSAAILAGGLIYNGRYSLPVFAIDLLALLAVFQLSEATVRRCLDVALINWAIAIPITLGYALLFVNTNLREPGPQAAQIVEQAWDARFQCGPAYILGETHRARVIGLYFGRPVFGGSEDDFYFSPWIDRTKLAQFGAVIVGGGDYDPQSSFRGEFSDLAPGDTFTLPFRHTFSDRRQDYKYFFVPPHCPGRNIDDPKSEKLR